MSKVCPECGREYFGKTVKCVHCNVPLVEKGNTGAGTTQQTRGRAAQQTRQTAAQINYQRVQNARAEQERARQQQLEQLQAQQQALLQAQQQVKMKNNKKKQGIPMKTWKLVSGILSIIMFVFVSLQSCAAGVYNALASNGEVSGSAGIIVAIMLLAGGIVSVACRKKGKGGSIAIAILYGIGSFIGIVLAGSYTDLKVWSFWCLVCMILAIISASGAGKAGIITAVSLGCVWLTFALISSGGAGNSSANSRSSARANREVSSKDTFGLLETAEMNDVQVRMTNYKESTGSEWNNPEDGKVYVLIEFEISNNSDSEISVSSLLSFDAYADGYSTTLSLGALMENENDQLDGSIAPGMKMRGWVGYEIPENWSELEIHFTENVWSGNKFKFLIANT